MIEHFNATDKDIGYNISKGGRAPFRGLKHSEESLQKMRIIKIGKKHSKETLKKLSLCKMGNKNPAKRIDVREKLKNNHANCSGKNNSMYDIHRYGKDAPAFGCHKSRNKGRVLPKEKCMYCYKECSVSNIIRWHNNNCKHILNSQ